MEKFSLLGVSFLNVEMQTALDLIAEAVSKQIQKTVFFINAECLNQTFSDKEYRETLQKADYVFPDGVGIKTGCKLLGKRVADNVNGTDMFPLLCEMVVKNNYSFFLLGAKPGVASKMKDELQKRYPTLRIAGEQHGYFDREKETGAVIDKINSSQANILLVAFGAPAQEKWIIAHKTKLKPTILMGVGGLFDFYSGNIPRAPLWMRRHGLEWTYRLYQEPRRLFKRYVLGNPLFIYRVMKRKYFGGTGSSLD